MTDSLGVVVNGVGIVENHIIACHPFPLFFYLKNLPIPLNFTFAPIFPPTYQVHNEPMVVPVEILYFPPQVFPFESPVPWEFGDQDWGCIPR